MEHKQGLLLTFALIFLSASCGLNSESQVTEAAPDMSNPASEFCLAQGFDLEIVTAPDGSQSGVCQFPDGSNCDEWAYFRGECRPASEATTPEAAELPTSTSEEVVDYNFPAAPTIDPAAYQGWWKYQHPVYGFSLLLPEDWTVLEETSSADLLSGHLITLLPDPALTGSIRITFREPDDQLLLWPTGVGQGEFIQQGTLEISGTTVQRSYLVCPGGEITSIWYQGTVGVPAVSLGGLEFGIIYHASGSHCEQGISLQGKNQLVGEMIIASLANP